MSGGRWSYRVEIVDGPSRAGSFEREGVRLHLPALIDIVPGAGGDIIDQKLRAMDPSWADLDVTMVRGGGSVGPWEDVVRAFLRRKGLDRLQPAVRSIGRSLMAG